jgi:putative addiction module antidote
VAGVRQELVSSQAAGRVACYNIRDYTSGVVLKIKLRKVGNSVGLLLPKDALSHLKVSEGDTVTVTEASDGSLRLSVSDPEVARQLEKAQPIIRRYRHALRELAK